MSDWQWTCYEAKLWDKRLDCDITVHVFGMTKEIARQKLRDEYPNKRWMIKEFNFHYVADPLSDPNSHKGAKGPNDN